MRVFVNKGDETVGKKKKGYESVGKTSGAHSPHPHSRP